MKKVVSDHAPGTRLSFPENDSIFLKNVSRLVPTAGPAFVPTPAQQETQTETVTHSRPQTVEEPVFGCDVFCIRNLVRIGLILSWIAL